MTRAAPRNPTSTIPVGAIPSDAEVEFIPIFGKVVVELIDDTDRRYGKLHLPPKSKGDSSIGRIVAVYAAAETDGGMVEPEVEVGDIVLIGQFTGTEATVNRKDVVICKEHDLLSILRFKDHEA